MIKINRICYGLLFIALVLSGCGSDDDSGNPEGESQWDSMNWDKNNWE